MLCTGESEDASENSEMHAESEKLAVELHAEFRWELHGCSECLVFGEPRFSLSGLLCLLGTCYVECPGNAKFFSKGQRSEL